MSMTQKEATFAAIVNVCGKVDGKYSPTKEQRAQVNNILLEGFRSGKVGYDGDFNALEEKDQKSYVSGLQSNWLRKDRRLNGNVEYQPKNPGSRAGSNDASIKAMRALLETKSDPTEKAEIQSFIDKRLAEIKPSKTVTINVDDLPEELRYLAEGVASS